MKRVAEKVRDIVEVCSFTQLQDFSADPGLTLAGYHFTDITADLMSKWIDRIASVRTGQGSSMALAGYRGVGKSHFIAVLAALVSRPELRSRISDSLVASSADRLSRRHGSVAFVRRGSGSSLIDELKRSVAELLGVNTGTLNDSLYDLLLKASDHAGELPLVLLIDTALGRGVRVARDDGISLSEIADAAETLGIFVGVALDDDISGADGPNSSISTSFRIDYLDQEHLYKIVDSHIFSKRSQMLPLLKEIYQHYREVLPGFRWSEQRFASLYPLHPATLEVAPLIRLYVHDFALLGFAAEAGVKILGRPANSLIGLDEVFDSVEKKLRLVPDLNETFSAFDKLEREVVSKSPAQFRHPAKLILKGLLMLSLNGQGASAAEIAASMMIFGDNAADPAAHDVASLLDSFAEALPRSVEKIERENSAAQYCFKLTATLDSDNLLAEAVKDVSDEIVWQLLLRQTAEKFADYEPSNDRGNQTTHCSVEWRGAMRRGEIVWNATGASETTRDQKDRPDWLVSVERAAGVNTSDGAAEHIQPIVWKLAEPTVDEYATIRRHHLLQTDTDIRAQFGDGLSTATHVHSMAVEKIWQRIFLQDGLVSAGGIDYSFTENARSAHTLAQMLSEMLGPIFDSEYPAHPKFVEVLGTKQAANLIANFFSGSGTNNAETQRLAGTIALPLGLAVKQDDAFIPTSSESLMKLDSVGWAFDALEPDESRVIPLTEISSRFHASPVGLTREAQHLVLAALVAQRRYEFVTSSGNRINQRSLDLQIIWDDIVGVAKPLNESYAPERLLAWAKLITGNSDIRSLDRAEDQLVVIDSLSGWLSDWTEGRIIGDFDALPDENLNAGIWRTAANMGKSFGAMADCIESLVKNDLSLDRCLQSIADLFSDSESDYESKKSDLRVLREFTAGVSRRSEIEDYLSLCESTVNPEMERSRALLMDAMATVQFDSVFSGSEHIEVLWTNFKTMYGKFYAEKHDAVMKSGTQGEKLREIIRSEEWSVFESLSAVTCLDQSYFERAKKLIREMRQLYCDYEVERSLVSKPYCNCLFSLSESGRLGELHTQLHSTVTNGLESYRVNLLDNGQRLATSADSDAMGGSVKQIVSRIGDGETFPHLTSQEIRILRLAAERMSEGLTSDINSTTRSGEEFSDLPPIDMQSWKQDIELVEAFANTEG